MAITVRKATEADIAKLKNNPAWDCVEFPKGLSCVWKVTKPVRNHYEFR